MRIGTATAASLVLLLELAPARPEEKLSVPVALVTGLCGGVLVFVALTRRVPRLSRRSRSRWLVVGLYAVVALWAANEELVWRRIVLGELLGHGAPVALAVSSVGFAVLHRARRLLHLGTGTAFGGVYLATGALAASIAAHWTYNVLVAELADQREETRC